VLSGLLPIDTHVAIKALADVALDTAMFNGHTTAADTLWTGTHLLLAPPAGMQLLLAGMQLPVRTYS
jgi:hypothetical protein